MKTSMFLVQLFLLFVLTNCRNDIHDHIEDEVIVDSGITFRQHNVDTDTKTTLIYYNEILGYDSIKYAFVLDEQAWQKLENKIIQSNIFNPPFPDFVIEITLNNILIYRVGYLPNLSATIRFDKMLFKLQEPNIIFIQPEGIY